MLSDNDQYVPSPQTKNDLDTLSIGTTFLSYLVFIFVFMNRLVQCIKIYIEGLFKMIFLVSTQVTLLMSALSVLFIKFLRSIWFIFVYNMSQFHYLSKFIAEKLIQILTLGFRVEGVLTNFYPIHTWEMIWTNIRKTCSYLNPILSF